MKRKKTACLLATVMLASLLTVGCVKEKKVSETKMFSYNYSEIGKVELYKRKHWVSYDYKLILELPEDKLKLEIIIPRHTDSSFEMTDQYGNVYILDQKNDHGLIQKFQTEMDPTE